MEASVSPSNIESRAETLSANVEKEAADAAAKVAADKSAADKSAADAAAKVAADKAAAEKVVTDKSKPAVDSAKPVEKTENSNMPNDPKELRKWATKASQESAALRDEVKALKAAIDKLSKKPVDYKELAKNPEAIQKQIELERQEAIAEMQDKLQEATTRAVAQETTVERIRREQDTVNYPEWKRLFPLIQNLAANTDGRINFNKAPSDVLDDLYALALQLAPVPPKVEEAPKPVQTGKTPEEVAAEIAAAEKRGFEKAQEALKAEQAGAGIGSAGKGGRRNSGVSKEALQTMPLSDLKKLISQE